MNRLLINSEWYDPIDPDSYIEQDFQDRLTANAGTIFWGWHVVPFTCDVHARDSGYGPRRPDLALVHPAYREWWVVEVELAKHDLAEHVMPQVVVFSLAPYDGKHAAHLCKQSPALDQELLETLVLSVQPGVLVVVNDDPLGWSAHLDRYGARLCIVKPYRTRLGRSCYVVQGHIPSSESTLLSRCQAADSMPRAIALLNPAVHVAPPGSSLTIQTPAGLSTWTYEKLGRTAFLFSTGRYPFSAHLRQFELHRSGDRLRLEPIARRDAWTLR